MLYTQQITMKEGNILQSSVLSFVMDTTPIEQNQESDTTNGCSVSEEEGRLPINA